MMSHVPREIHLDFHNAAAVGQIGADFDAADFADTAKNAGVTSMNIFAKCHHGYSYYPTTVGEIHPGLGFDLLGAQIQALHSVGIKAQIYISVLWDDLMGEQHPEWVITTREGRTLMRRPLSADSPNTGTIGWTTLDVATGYGDYVAAMVDELMDHYEVDGFWFDIVWAQPNFSPVGQKRMRDSGVRQDDADAVARFFTDEINVFMQRMSERIRARNADTTIFYNGTVTPTMREVVPFMSQVEIESLPTSGDMWGYPHFPQLARFARTFNKPMLGMTGRFHKSWADFGGLKKVDQLLYECGTIISAGAGVSVGDQLDPSGRLDPAVYRMIGSVFDHVKLLEPWLTDSYPLTEVGVLGAIVDSIGGEQPTSVHDQEVEGISQMLLELGIQFDILDPRAESLNGYKVLILPQSLRIDHQLLIRIEDARDDGTRIVLSGSAALDPETGSFLLAGMPVRYGGPAPTVPSYLRLDSEQCVSELASDYDYVFYDQAHQVEPVDGALAWGDLKAARYNRTWEHFTSHAHAPVGATLGSPLVVSNEQVLYFAVPLFAAYANHDYWVYREIFAVAFGLFLPERLIRVSGPGWVEATRHRQGLVNGRSRDIVHLTTYQARRINNGAIPHVDQAAAVAGLSLELSQPNSPVTRAYVAPNGPEIAFELGDGVIRLELPPIGRHTLVVLE